MFKLRVVQAHEGDSLVILHGSPDAPRALLCDGGPEDTFEPHLRRTLETLETDTLDAAILSHVDKDHVIGLLDLFANLRDAQTPFVRIDDLWFNAFSRTLDVAGALEPRLVQTLQGIASQGQVMGLAGVALQGIKEGHALQVLARQADVPISGITGGDPFVADNRAPFDLHGLQVQIVGPTQDNLDRLAEQWEGWLERQEERLASGELRLAAMADRSVPNLSSIQLLLTAAGKTLLLTGDGRGDHLLDALEQAQLLRADATLTVDVFKVPHHGSDRNVTRAFFERIRAHTYVISANGKHDNPDFPTLQWIIESRSPEEPIEIVLTNRTESVDRLEQSFPADEFGYQLRIRPDDADFIDVDLA